jgi:hypothetical protein
MSRYTPCGDEGRTHRLSGVEKSGKKKIGTQKDPVKTKMHKN